jgi:rfaE bifunctional protein nucleotidyltransferase chain/domain
MRERFACSVVRRLTVAVRRVTIRAPDPADARIGETTDMEPRTVLTLDEIARRLEAPRREGRKIVHCHGCFDLMHIGHIKHLQAARALGDVLVVTVTADAHVNKGEGRPAFTEAQRADSLAALACVDFVAVHSAPSAVDAIRRLRPHYYVKGQAAADPAGRSANLRSEIETVRSVGGEVRFTHEMVFSSTALLNTHFRVPHVRA